jgi:SAM-dependent methyltransferase
MAFSGQEFAWRLYRYGVASGVASLSRVTEAKFAAGLLLHPVGYWESVELPLMMRELLPAPGERILDVGGPKLMALYLAEKLGARVDATEVREAQVRNFTRLRELRHVPGDRLHITIASGEGLPYDDELFSKAYCMDVITPREAGAGLAVLRELCRVLLPGGRCSVTIPFNAVGRSGDAGFSEDSMRALLIEGSGLVVDKVLYLGEALLNRSRQGLAEYLHPLMGALLPALSGIVHVEGPLSSTLVKRPRRAFLLLRKPVKGDAEVHS